MVSYLSDLRKFRSYLENRVSAGTVKVYMNALEHWFASLNGKQPTVEAAQEFVDLLAKSKSPSTVGLHAHAIMRWFRWKKQQVRLDCPTIRIGEPKYLKMPQIEAVLTACRTVLESTLVVVLFDTAVRINELLNIELNDIDWDNGIMSVMGKGGRKEEVNISEKALDALRDWLDARGSRSKRVFMDFSYYDAWIMIKNIGKRAGIPLHPHVFRHSRAVHMRMNGAELHTVQQHLRHKSITTTANIYGRFRAIDLKELVPSW